LLPIVCDQTWCKGTLGAERSQVNWGIDGSVDAAMERCGWLGLRRLLQAANLMSMVCARRRCTRQLQLDTGSI